MTSDRIERRVGRLENETESIYELIDDFRTETHARFDTLETKVDQLHDFRTETHTRLGSLETTLTDVQATLTEVVRRLPEPS